MSCFPGRAYPPAVSVSDALASQPLADRGIKHVQLLMSDTDTTSARLSGIFYTNDGEFGYLFNKAKNSIKCSVGSIVQLNPARRVSKTRFLNTRIPRVV